MHDNTVANTADTNLEISDDSAVSDKVYDIYRSVAAQGIYRIRSAKFFQGV